MTKFARPPTPFHTEADLEIPLDERKTVATLGANECRWPFGDPTEKGFHFCGKPNVEGRPYCEFHEQRASQPARPRTVQPRPTSG